MKACPDEPVNEERKKVVQMFGTLIYNPIYEKQKQVGPWK
jgi:hypothetical protein